jgi:ATP-dependent Clp protease, protease subunit
MKKNQKPTSLILNTKTTPAPESIGGPIPIGELLHMLQGGSSDQELDEHGIIVIDHEITRESLSEATKKLLIYHFNESFTDPIQIILNSLGGECAAGWAFIDVMRFIKNEVRTIAVGEICSMASYIFIAGDERIMAPNCSAMIHQFSDGVEGSRAELIARQKSWDIEYDRHLRHLATYSKYKDVEDIKKHLLQTTDNWLTAKEMKQHGLCDHIFEPRPFKKKKG